MIITGIFQSRTWVLDMNSTPHSNLFSHFLVLISSQHEHNTFCIFFSEVLSLLPKLGISLEQFKDTGADSDSLIIKDDRHRL
jgi:hypothetical protein